MCNNSHLLCQGNKRKKYNFLYITADRQASYITMATNNNMGRQKYIITEPAIIILTAC